MVRVEDGRDVDGASRLEGDVRTFRLDVQYDGTSFYGWARQPGRETVEESLEGALAVYLGRSVDLSVAGRTDAGVHARGQVASIRLPGPVADAAGLHREEGLGRALIGLKALTPPGLSVTRITRMPEGFDARRSATARSYRYFIWRGLVPSPFRARYTWHVRGDLDEDSMEAAAGLMLGRHDFTAFTPSETHHLLFERTIERCRWRRQGSLLWLEVRAPHFLRHMVRTMVGTMVDVGRGRRDPADLPGLLEGVARAEAGRTAPAHGLFLWRVYYDPPSP